MGTAYGSLGSSGKYTYFNNQLVTLNVTLGANEYPNGTFTLNNLGQNQAYWGNNDNSRRVMQLWLTDANRSVWYRLFDIDISGNQYSYTPYTTTISGAQAFAGKTLYVEGYDSDSGTSRKHIYLRNGTSITFQTASLSHNVYCNAGTGGSLTASTSSAAAGATVTLYPVASTGYYLTGYTTSPSVTVGGNTFTMPDSNITVTANFAKITYTITKGVSPSGAGTLTGAGSATMGTSVTLTRTTTDGYQFDGWTTSPSLSISGTTFTMPASNVSITARYIRRSTASLNTLTLTGGGSVTLTIGTESAAYTHKYRIYFASGMDTGLVNVGAGTTSVSISIPMSWCNSVTSATTKTGGWLKLYTYRNGSQIASEYTISSLTFAVPASVVPSVGTITTSIARTIDNVTYANIGDLYTQLHSGVRVQAGGSGIYSSTITSIKVALSGYSGSRYNNTTAGAGPADFTTGLLSIAGSQTITVTVTDSRGRTASKTATITVTPYNAPSGKVSVRRVDAQGDDDDMGLYAKYALEKNYSNIGSNSLTVAMTVGSDTATVTNDTGDVIPGNRKTFQLNEEKTVTVTLTDAFETTVITTKVRSAQFIIYVDSSGDKIGFMKATTKTPTSPKTSTVEFSEDSEIYIGDYTLDQYIRNVVNNM